MDRMVCLGWWGWFEFVMIAHEIPHPLTTLISWSKLNYTNLGSTNYLASSVHCKSSLLRENSAAAASRELIFNISTNFMETVTKIKSLSCDVMTYRELQVVRVRNVFRKEFKEDLIKF